jgi:pentatricopeptide repeat protein
MVKGIERCGEAVGTEAKSAILAGLSLAGRLDEAIGLYAEIKKEGVLPTAYAVSSLMVWSLKFPSEQLHIPLCFVFYFCGIFQPQAGPQSFSKQILVLCLVVQT